MRSKFSQACVDKTTGLATVKSGFASKLQRKHFKRLEASSGVAWNHNANISIGNTFLSSLNVTHRWKAITICSSRDKVQNSSFHKNDEVLRFACQWLCLSSFVVAKDALNSVL